MIWRIGEEERFGVAAIVGDFEGQDILLASCVGPSWSYPDGGKMERWRKQRAENMELIVESVNHYPALLAAARAVLMPTLVALAWCPSCHGSDATCAQCAFLRRTRDNLVAVVEAAGREGE